ncbi:hypothetical protein F4810DRAFT_710216 [Camillea tinctor]|nr:hypothetical protein F4810DRAFT_710216 [Camillea tinctor]
MSSQHRKDSQSDEEMVDAPSIATEATPSRGGRGRGRGRGSRSGPASQPSRPVPSTPQPSTPQRPSPAGSQMPATPSARRSIPLGHFPGSNIGRRHPLPTSRPRHPLPTSRPRHPLPTSRPRPPTEPVSLPGASDVASVLSMGLNAPGPLPRPVTTSQPRARPQTPPSGFVLRTITNPIRTAEERRNQTTPQGVDSSENSGHEDSPSPSLRAIQPKKARGGAQMTALASTVTPQGRARTSSASKRGRGSRATARTPAERQNLAPALPNVAAQLQNTIDFQQPAGPGAGPFQNHPAASAAMQYESSLGYAGDFGVEAGPSNVQAPATTSGSGYGAGNDQLALSPAPGSRPSPGFPRNPVSFGLDALHPVSAYIHLYSPNVGGLGQHRHRCAGSTACPYPRAPSIARPVTALPAQRSYSSYNDGFSMTNLAQQPMQQQLGGPSVSSAFTSSAATTQAQVSPPAYNIDTPAIGSASQSGQQHNQQSAAPDDGIPDFGFGSNVPRSTRVSLPNDINAGTRTAGNPFYYESGYAPAFQFPHVPSVGSNQFWYTNPWARPLTWAATDDPNLVLPPDVYHGLDQYMMKNGVLNMNDRMWAMGVQYGIGLGVSAYKESLMDELEIEGRLFGRVLQVDRANDTSLTMCEKIKSEACGYFDLAQAHRAAKKYITSSELLAETIEKKGIEASLPAAGSHVAPPALFPNNSEAQAHASSLNAALASEINRPPPGNLHAQPKPLVGPYAITEHLPEYEGVSARGQAQHGTIAPLIDNAINATRIPQGMPHFAAAAAPVSNEDNDHEMHGAASGAGSNHNQTASGSSEDADEDPEGFFGRYGPKYELAETPEGRAYIRRIQRN